MAPSHDEGYESNMEKVICVPRNASQKHVFLSLFLIFQLLMSVKCHPLSLMGSSDKWFSGQIIFRSDEAVKSKVHCSIYQIMRLQNELVTLSEGLHQVRSTRDQKFQ